MPRVRSAGLILLLAWAAVCGACRHRAASASPAPPPAPVPPASTPPPASPPPAEPGSVVAELREDAARLRPLFESAWVRGFLDATSDLPAVAPRTVYLDADRSRAWSEAEASALSVEERAALTARDLDERFYYTTRYGTPLAYARPLQILADQGFRPAGRKILDFGYGGIGQLRLLAAAGAEACGVEVDPLLRALYSDPSDQGPVGVRSGRLRLVDGRFPSEPAAVEAVGSGFDLVLSKNVLKRGYIHPEQPVPERQRVSLGVEDEAFVARLFEILRPGGLFLIYNLSPAPNGPGLPYRPWADGRCPFPREILEAAGFRVVAFDRDDSVAAREMARALGWDRGDAAMNPEEDLFAHYTLSRKPENAAPAR